MKRKNRIGCLYILMLALMLSACAPAVQEEMPPATLPAGDLTCLEISRFSGGFVEDGSDEAVADVAAILISNDTGKFLDLATVTYTVGDRTATFQVTGLPSGEKAWVLEKDRMRIAEGDALIYKDCQTTFHANAIQSTDDLAVTRQGNTLTVVNKSGKTLKNVCIYYKNRLEDGAFMGGITYLVNFGDLEPGGSAQRSVAHLGDSSEIVRYSYQMA